MLTFCVNPQQTAGFQITFLFGSDFEEIDGIFVVQIFFSPDKFRILTLLIFGATILVVQNVSFFSAQIQKKYLNCERFFVKLWWFYDKFCVINA